MEAKVFANQIINWYHHHKRDLSWRHTRDPYKIWLSEIILQQTRVAQGKPYYEKFVNTYPTVFELAAASETEVLRLWQGLGYYSRARNLHACAKMVVNEYEGRFPDTYDELLKLKGVGKYTAAAIAAFAFDQPAAVVDGNVYRVLSRVFGIAEDIASTKGAKTFEKKAWSLVPETTAADYNQGIMEFGALQCTPKSPACALCPFSLDCYAYNHNAQDSLPVKLKKVKVRTRYFHYLVFKSGEQYWMKERGPKDVWQGLYDFEIYEGERALDTEAVLDAVPESLRPHLVLANESAEYKHILTHQRIFARFYLLEAGEEAKGLMSSVLKPYSIEEIKALPKPVLIQKYLEDVIF